MLTTALHHTCLSIALLKNRLPLRLIILFCSISPSFSISGWARFGLEVSTGLAHVLEWHAWKVGVSLWNRTLCFKLLSFQTIVASTISHLVHPTSKESWYLEIEHFFKQKIILAYINKLMCTNLFSSLWCWAPFQDCSYSFSSWNLMLTFTLSWCSRAFNSIRFQNLTIRTITSFLI